MRFFEAGVLAFLWASLFTINSTRFKPPKPATRALKLQILRSQLFHIPPGESMAESSMSINTSDKCMPRGTVAIPENGEYKYILIFLHGYNRVDKSKKILTMLRRHKNFVQNWKFVMPTAPEKTHPNGTVTVQWADPPNLEKDIEMFQGKPFVKEDTDGFSKSIDIIRRLIQCESQKTGVKGVVLGGFSQGGATAYATGLQYDKPLLGLFGIACWVPMFAKPPTWTTYRIIEVSQAAKTLSVLHLHGKNDKKILPKYGEVSVGYMTWKGINVLSSYNFDVEHDLIQEEADAVANYLDAMTT